MEGAHMKVVKKNKGFSFVEILVAITLLAIIIGPIMNSLISSAKINRESRRLMCASDCAQDIMEGLSDKEYYEVLEHACRPLGGKVLAANAALSNVNENAFNDRNAGNLLDASTFGTYLTGCTNSTITFEGVTFNTIDLLDDTAMISGNIASDYMLSKWAATAASSANGIMTAASNNDKKVLTMWSNASFPASASDVTETKNTCIFFAYSNVDWESYKFNVYGYIIPVAQSSSATYYPYTIKIAVYEQDKHGASAYSTSDVPIVTIVGGLRSK